MTTATTTTTTVEHWSASSSQQHQQRSPITRTSKQNTVPQPHHDDTNSKVTAVPEDIHSSTAHDSPPPPLSPPPCKLVLDGRRRWALILCAHCRDYASLTCVLTCYSKVAHHREVKLVTDEGVRESIGVLSEKQLVFEDQDGGKTAANAAAAAVLPPTTGDLGRVVRLNQDAVDRGILCTVSCEQCAGQPLGQCIDAGHNQQVKG